MSQQELHSYRLTSMDVPNSARLSTYWSARTKTTYRDVIGRRGGTSKTKEKNN